MRGSKVEAGRKDVARHHPEGLGAGGRQQLQRLGNATGGFQRTAVVAAFHRVVDRQAPAAAIAQHNGVLRLQPGGVDHHLSHPGTCQGFEVVFDQWLAMHRQQRFGGGIGERAHALAAAGGKDQGAGRLCVSRHATSLGGCRALPQPSPMGAGALFRILRNSGR